ncbi:MAG: dynamin family protein [Gammaproteobacteria bacterium]
MPSTSRASRGSSVIPREFTRDREKVQEFIERVRPVVEALGASAYLTEFDQLAAGARKPFLFVAVGEVKSGKSSLINALLEAPVCAVDSAPCTDRVQEINYGARRRRTTVSELEERVQLPHDILKHISIVDTPGVNSIIRGHQVITENYLPQSDLILFVFFAKNPYTGSAWDFLHHIKHDWQRNTLFVLQQADLLDAEDLERTIALVTQQLTKEGFAKPVVFPVSVLTGTGVDTLRDYLRTEVVKGRQFNKSISLTHNLRRFLRRIESTLEDHACLLQYDQEGLAHLKQRLQETVSEAEREYRSLAHLARHHIEATQRWLDAHFTRIRGGSSAPAQPAFPNGQDTSALERLQEHGQRLARSAILRDAVLSGWETPLRMSERFNHLQAELTRCLFQAEMRNLNVFQNGKRAALQVFDAIPVEPPCLSTPPKDSLARKRLQSLKRIRKALQTMAEPNPPDPAPQLPALRALTRWSLTDRGLQVSTGLGAGAVGYHLGDLFTVLLLGLSGYLGAGFVLAARNRRRMARHAREALDAMAETIDRRLRAALLDNASRRQQVLQKIVARFEANLLKRHATLEELRATTSNLRAAVESFESATWHKAVEHND